MKDVYCLYNCLKFEELFPIWYNFEMTWGIYFHENIVIQYWLLIDSSPRLQVNFKFMRKTISTFIHMSRPLRNCRNFNFAPLYRSFWCISKNYNHFNLNNWKNKILTYFWEVTSSILVKMRPKKFLFFLGEYLCRCKPRQNFVVKLHSNVFFLVEKRSGFDKYPNYNGV